MVIYPVSLENVKKKKRQYLKEKTLISKGDCDVCAREFQVIRRRSKKCPYCVMGTIRPRDKLTKEEQKELDMEENNYGNMGFNFR